MLLNLQMIVLTIIYKVQLFRSCLKKKFFKYIFEQTIYFMVWSTFAASLLESKLQRMEITGNR